MTDSARHRSATLKPVAHCRPSSPTPTVGIRAHLAHLLPRHTTFTLTITIHQLNNVPLVHGEFGLRWKIKGVASNFGTGILDKVKARKAKANLCHGSSPPSVVKGSDTDNASLFDATSASDAHSVANSSNDHASAPTTYAQPLSIPAVVVSANHASPPKMERSVSGASSIVSASSSTSDGRLNHNPPGYLSAYWSRHGPAPSPPFERDANIFPSPSATKHHYSPAKGITPFVQLREHSIVWEKELKFVVQMSVARDDELGDSLATFIVMQRVIAGDPDAPRNPRLGAVYLNLAQYVNAGVVTRRYLLRQSKTNATLKLSIHLEHTSGESAYVAPPLPKDEILSGVAGILESSDIHRTRPRASDLFVHASSDFSSESDTSSVISGSGTSNGQSHRHGHATVKKHRRPFEVAKLPSINDPRGTEKLIEALFNPVPVTQPNKVTPFTYLIEVVAEGDPDAEHGSYRADADSEGRDTQGAAIDVGDDGSLYADWQEESEGDADGLRSDYHSLRSHPSAQGSLRSKRSTRSLANKVGLALDDGGKETVVSKVVQPQDGTTERRAWWQKVLSPPSPGG